MNQSLLDSGEVRRARVGPRPSKDPASREYAIQTLYMLKQLIESKNVDEKRILREIDEIKTYQHWKILGYPSIDDYLKTETGRSLKEILGEAHANTLRAICALAREQGVPVNGRNQHNRGHDNYQALNKYGTDAVYLARRILGEDEQVFEKLERGEFRSVRSAAIQAGIIKQATTPSPLEQTQRWFSKLTDSERKHFLEWATVERTRDENQGQIPE